jgi:cell division GTPase FtsZ
MNEVLQAMNIVARVTSGSTVCLEMDDVREIIKGANKAHAASSMRHGTSGFAGAVDETVAMLAESLGLLKASGIIILFIAGWDINLSEMAAAAKKMMETLCAEDAQMMLACDREENEECNITVSAVVIV